MLKYSLKSSSLCSETENIVSTYLYIMQNVACRLSAMIRLHLTDRHLRVMLWCILLGLQPAFGGILDPFNWARSDRIEVNIPWLPCKNIALILKNAFRIQVSTFNADRSVGNLLTFTCVVGTWCSRNVIDTCTYFFLIRVAMALLW